MVWKQAQKGEAASLTHVSELGAGRAENCIRGSRFRVQCSSSNATLPLSPSLGPYSVPGSCPALSHTHGHSRIGDKPLLPSQGAFEPSQSLICICSPASLSLRGSFPQCAGDWVWLIPEPVSSPQILHWVTSRQNGHVWVRCPAREAFPLRFFSGPLSLGSSPDSQNGVFRSADPRPPSPPRSPFPPGEALGP